MRWFSRKRIYLDYAAATSVLPEVRRAMDKYFSENFYNPRAIYREGIRVKAEVDDCRRKIAQISGVTADGVIFTGGGTEANNLAILGVAKLVDRPHIIISENAHPSVLRAAEETGDFSIWRDGEPLPLKGNTVLISVSSYENDIGRQVRDIRKKNHSNYPLLHIDASSSANYFSPNIEELACDMLTLNASKIYGPKGIGALVVRRGIELNMLHQGTPAVPLVIGFAKALEIAMQSREGERLRLESLKLEFIKEVKNLLPQTVFHSSFEDLPNTINISVPKILPEMLVLALDREGIAVSSGSACSFEEDSSDDYFTRFSFGRMTTKSDVDIAMKTFCRVAKNLLKSSHAAI